MTNFVKKIKRKKEYYKLGGVKLLLSTLYDKLNNTNTTSDQIYEICKNADEKEYPKIIESIFYIATGDKLDLQNPKTMNEKTQWLKLYDNTELKGICADKYSSREYVKNKIGDKYLIPLLGVWEKFEDIDFDSLPSRFVIKCVHGSGFNYIVKDKAKLDKEDLKQKILRWQGINYAYYNLELQYKNIKPLIIAEKFLEENISDYKIYCYNGHCDFLELCVDRENTNRHYYYDKEWNFYKFDVEGLKDSVLPSYTKPDNLNELFEVASKLSEDFKYVRVDLYSVGGKTYFGELTFTSGGGMMKDSTKEFDEIIGSKIKLY